MTESSINYIQRIEATKLRTTSRLLGCVAAATAALSIAGCSSERKLTPINTALPVQIYGHGDANFKLKAQLATSETPSKLFLGMDFLCHDTSSNNEITVSVPSLGVKFQDNTCNNVEEEAVAINPEDKLAKSGGYIDGIIKTSQPNIKWVVGEVIK